MPKNGEAAKCEKNLVWTWQSSYAGKHDKFAGVAVSPDKTYIIASGVRGSKSKDRFQLIVTVTLIPVSVHLIVQYLLLLPVQREFQHWLKYLSSKLDLTAFSTSGFALHCYLFR